MGDHSNISLFPSSSIISVGRSQLLAILGNVMNISSRDSSSALWKQSPTVCIHRREFRENQQGKLESRHTMLSGSIPCLSIGLNSLHVNAIFKKTKSQYAFHGFEPQTFSIAKAHDPEGRYQTPSIGGPARPRTGQPPPGSFWIIIVGNTH